MKMLKFYIRYEKLEAVGQAMNYAHQTGKAPGIPLILEIDADWVTGLGAHLMILVPNIKSMDSVPTEWRNGGPWIMWNDTPYEHLMIPIESMAK